MKYIEVCARGEGNSKVSILDIIDYTDWFLKLEANLHFLDEPLLILVYYFYVLLDMNC